MFVVILNAYAVVQLLLLSLFFVCFVGVLLLFFCVLFLLVMVCSAFLLLFVSCAYLFRLICIHCDETFNVWTEGRGRGEGGGILQKCI